MQPFQITIQILQKDPRNQAWIVNYKIYLSYLFLASPITSSNVSLIEDGLNNFHFSRPTRKFISADQLNPAAQKNKKNMNTLLEEDEKNSPGKEEYSDLYEILDCLESTKLSDYIRTQKGSRNMQKLLNKITPDELDIILKEIGDFLPELMVDPYSNYLCQKLAQCCSSEQRIFFLKKVNLFLKKDSKRIYSNLV